MTTYPEKVTEMPFTDKYEGEAVVSGSSGGTVPSSRSSPIDLTFKDNKTKPNIATIPSEILLQIFESLNCPVASQCLGLTCKLFLSIHCAIYPEKMPLGLIADFAPKTEDPQWLWLHTLLQDWMGEGLTYSRAQKKFANLKIRDRTKEEIRDELQVESWLPQEASWRSHEYQQHFRRLSISSPQRSRLARSKVVTAENALKLKGEWEKTIILFARRQETETYFLLKPLSSIVTARGNN